MKRGCGMKTEFRFPLVCLAALLLGLTFSCSGREEKGAQSGDKRLNVVVSLFPLYDFAKHIGGDKVSVALLLPPGVEPHSFEPRPGDMAALSKASVFIYTNREMEPWVEDVLKGIKNPRLTVIDSGREILPGERKEKRRGKKQEHDMDPHLWLDFSLAAKMAQAVRDGLIEKDPANRAFYERNAGEFRARLDALDRKFRAGLSDCDKRVFVHGGHFAFGYLARRYNLDYMAAYGFSPDAEPSPGDLARLSRTLRQNGLNHIFYEEMIMPRVAETIAKETGAELLMLHGAHNVSKEDMDRGVTFMALMEKNLDNLRTGLQCR